MGLLFVVVPTKPSQTGRLAKTVKTVFFFQGNRDIYILRKDPSEANPNKDVKQELALLNYEHYVKRCGYNSLL